MATINPRKRKRGPNHPYLSGNFAPLYQTQPLTPCAYTGTIPEEVIGGQYVRNGGNPVTNEDLGRDAHWFDGDGMLAGVNFRRTSQKDGQVQPEFVNQYILTDVLLSTLSTPTLKSPILPSIATLVNPASSLIAITLRIIRTICLVLLSHLPGSRQAIRKISVANTSIMYHDGRALATCESGPPMRIALPSLETIGWYNGKKAQNEGSEPKGAPSGEAFGGTGLLSFMKEWTTAHPKVDPGTNEMILFHSTFAPPYLHYSIIPATHQVPKDALPATPLVNAAVPGVSSAKMMHDFGVSKAHTIIMDLPLSLDPLNLAKNKAVVAYDSAKPSRFGVFPRRDPSNVRWFETSACCIFHTANTWDTLDNPGVPTSVNLLACRLTSASLVFSAGNIAAPHPTEATAAKVIKKRMPFFSKYDDDASEDPEGATHLLSKIPESHGDNDPYPISSCDLDYSGTETNEEEQCRLYYYSFSLSSQTNTNTILHQFALSAIPFEFPSTHPGLEMSAARYIYGCTTTSSTFGAALGRAVQIDALVKIDALTLIAHGQANPPTPVTGCVDTRPVHQILEHGNTDDDPIRIFRMPKGWYAQEPRFVPRKDAQREDDGWLLTYAFDEARWLDEETGEVKEGARSELWIIDARGMRDVVARVELPQRVPYGLHGNWFGEEKVLGQRGWEAVRRVDDVVGIGIRKEGGEEGGLGWKMWMGIRRWLEGMLA